jgi:hypothetical protein
MYRRFPRRIEDMAKVWRAHAYTTEQWTFIEDVGVGESEVFKVQNQSGLYAYAKPSHDLHSDTPRAAHEKIASDLAYDIKLPVPPVQIWRSGPKDRGGLFALSLMGFDQPMDWNVAVERRLVNEAICKSVAPAISACDVFHTWIGDLDRKSEHVQIDLDAADSNMGISVIDHAYAMTHIWRSDQKHPLHLCETKLAGVDKNRAAIHYIVGKIERCRNDSIKDICARVPGEFLSDAQREAIVSNLITRRDEIGDYFEVAKGATG